MKTVMLLAAAVMAVSGASMLAQQPGSTAPQQAPPERQQAPTQQATPTQPSAPSTPMAEMKTVNGELVSNLDSKTAKTGDSIVIETKQPLKTADGTDIPQGSKITGHVLGVKPSGQGNENSQVALAFDRAELKGGQTVPVKTELRSISPPGSETPGAGPNAPSSTGAAPTGGSSGSASSSAGSSGSQSPNGGGTPSTGANPSETGSAQGSSGAGGSAAAGGTGPAGAANGQPPAGVVVARTGNIDIRTTAIPGVLLANNQPGTQDPRMAQSSGILLGARRDIHLDGGTQVVIAVAGAGTSGGGN